MEPQPVNIHINNNIINFAKVPSYNTILFII